MRKHACLMLAAAMVASFALTVEAKPAKKGPADEFPGVGSIEAWRGSRVDWRAGMESMKAHKWDDAVLHFKASLAMYSYQPKAWIEIGRANEERDGNVEEAEKAYREAIKIDTNSWQAWKRLANVLLMQKKYTEARQAAASAVQLNPPPEARKQLDQIIQQAGAGQGDENRH